MFSERFSLEGFHHEKFTKNFLTLQRRFEDLTLSIQAFHAFIWSNSQIDLLVGKFVLVKSCWTSFIGLEQQLTLAGWLISPCGLQFKRLSHSKWRPLDLQPTVSSTLVIEVRWQASNGVIAKLENLNFKLWSFWLLWRKELTKQQHCFTLFAVEARHQSSSLKSSPSRLTVETHCQNSPPPLWLPQASVTRTLWKIIV